MASTGTGRRGALLVGLLVLVAGLAGAVVLYLVSERRRDDAIRDLARAPVGCDTTLSFTDTGTFFVFVEHLGVLESISGDCDAPGEYSRDPDDEPRLTVTVTAADGDTLELDRLEHEFTYRLGSEFAGTARRRLEIESAGDHVVTVDSEDRDFVVAVGRDPRRAGRSALIGALAAGIGGLVLGGGLLLYGVSRRRGPATRPAPLPSPPGWPLGPPPSGPPLLEPHLLRPPVVPPPAEPPLLAPPTVLAPPTASPTAPPWRSDDHGRDDGEDRDGGADDVRGGA
jgi:hypothetical protein